MTRVFVDLNTIGLIWPEIILILVATWIYVGGTITPSQGLWTLLAVVTYAVATWVLVSNESALWAVLAQGQVRWSGPLTVDYLGQMTRLFSLGIGVLLTLLGARTGVRKLSSERVASLMVVVAGMMLVSRANDLVFLFVSLELISIPTYVLLFLGRRDRTTEEATVKYFFLSILSSAVLLYGMTFLYGVAGGTTIIAGSSLHGSIQEAVAQLAPEKMGLYLVGLVMVVFGLGFKIAAVPFHFYAPDVYQGATNANAGLLAVAPKIAGVLALIRLVAGTLPINTDVPWQLVLVVALATMTLGNTCALWQNNVRRLMAYSSIAHAGYMLIGLSVAMAMPQYGGVAAMVFYLVVYVMASLGTFAALAYLSTDRHEVGELRELSGLGRSRPWIAGAIAICMFSLAGIPPLAGFWGKLTLFTGSVQVAMMGGGSRSTWFLVLAVVGMLNAATAAAYYLRVVSTMYFRPVVVAHSPGGGSRPLLAMVACVVCVVGLGAMPGALLDSAQSSDPLMHQAVAPMRPDRDEIALARFETAEREPVHGPTAK